MFTISDECKYRVKKVQEILDEYDILEEDKETILSEIKEGWYQAHEAYTSGRALENFIKSKGIDLSLQDYMRFHMEEDKKYPFDLDEGEDAEQMF